MAGWIRGRPNLARRLTVEQFWAKIERGDGCWTWLASVSPWGYGRSPFPGRSGRLVMAHRIAWELTNGPIPDGLIVCHHCDNPRCCRPDHMFLGTDKDNAMDAARKGRMGSANRKRTHCKLGHPFDYLSPDGRRGCLTCRRRQAAECRARAYARSEEPARRDALERLGRAVAS